MGKALGGASGGYTSARQEIVDYLRQRSRPYLFSNSLAPPIVQGTIKALELVTQSPDLREQLRTNTEFMRKELSWRSFEVLEGEHPIIPMMLGDAELATKFAESMLEKGVYVVGFSYPVVPVGKARIRTQMSAIHSAEDLDFAVECFEKTGRELGVIS
jgi:glycine C-acetyltransferase